VAIRDVVARASTNSNSTRSWALPKALGGSQQSIYQPDRVHRVFVPSAPRTGAEKLVAHFLPISLLPSLLGASSTVILGGRSLPHFLNWSTKLSFTYPSVSVALRGTVLWLDFWETPFYSILLKACSGQSQQLLPLQPLCGHRYLI
jgi:hypothetical protein